MRPVEQQTILVTGATSGLGRALTETLAEMGATVVAHGRDENRLERTAQEVAAATGRRIDTVRADLAEIGQVDRLADVVLERYAELHTLVNNAGVGFGPPDGRRETSADGVELRFAVNHLASLALARRLSQRLVDSAPSRIVQVASAGQLALDPDDPLSERSYDGVSAYRRSKLAQVMATYDLAEDLAGTGVSVTALHPATFMDTAMVREHGIEPASSVGEGLDAVLRLVTDPALDGVTGRYFHGTEQARPDPQAEEPQARAWLRSLSDDLLRQARERHGAAAGSPRAGGPLGH
jgi:NAD(P)-dependent dehydrogenase (short-subunit alcohol dehydrogenase family)